MQGGSITGRDGRMTVKTVKTVAGLGKECGERGKTCIRLELDVNTTFSGLVNAAGSVNKSRLASKMAMRGSTVVDRRNLARVLRRACPCVPVDLTEQQPLVL